MSLALSPARMNVQRLARTIRASRRREPKCPTTSSSSEAAPQAMCAPSARRSSASRPPSSEMRDLWRHLPQHRLHSLEGVAARLRIVRKAGHGFAAFGVDVPAPKLNLDAMMAHKDATVKANVDGVAFLFKKNKIDGVRGTGRIAAPGKVEVKAEDGSTRMLETKSIVIATGSEVTELKGVRSTRSGSSLRPGPWSFPRRRNDCLSSAPALSGSSSARCGGVGTGRGDRVSRPHPAGHGCRNGETIPTPHGKARREIPSLAQGHQAELTKNAVTLTVEPAAGGDATTMAADVCSSRSGDGR